MTIMGGLIAPFGGSIGGSSGLLGLRQRAKQPLIFPQEFVAEAQLFLKSPLLGF
jgi:hypothetical protein